MLRITEDGSGDAICGGLGLQVAVRDGACDAAQSVASVAVEPVAGRTAVVSVQAKDAAGNERTAPAATYVGDGLYRLEYAVAATAALALDVSMDGTSLGNAPLALTVWPSPLPLSLPLFLPFFFRH